MAKEFELATVAVEQIDEMGAGDAARAALGIGLVRQDGYWLNITVDLPIEFDPSVTIAELREAIFDQAMKALRIAAKGLSGAPLEQHQKRLAELTHLSALQAPGKQRGDG